MLLPVLLFALGLLCLIKGGDWFVDGAVGIARRLYLPEALIGATIVSIGTTLPEVMVSATSALSGHGQIAYGNAVGSILCNTALIAALTAAIRPGKVDQKALRLPVGFFFIAAALVSVPAYLLGRLTRPVGVALLVCLGVYLFAATRQVNQATVTAQEAAPFALPKMILLLAGGAALIAVGADLLVDHGTRIAKGLGVPESVIALTFVALGTSLPELITAVSSLLKGHSALSLGNVIGANLLNLVLATGASATLAPFDLPADTLLGMNTSLVLDLPLMLLVMVMLTIPALKNGRLYRSQGILLLGLYGLFCLVQFFL